MAERVWQEFYCATSGGGCGGFFTVKINMHLTRRIVVVCPNPKCKHEHTRCVENGHIKDKFDNGMDRYGSGTPDEYVYVPVSAYTKEPKTKIMQSLVGGNNERVSVVISGEGDLKPQTEADLFVAESWKDKHLGEV